MKTIISAIAALSFPAALFAAQYTFDGNSWQGLVDGTRDDGVHITSSWGIPVGTAPTHEDSLFYDGNAGLNFFIMGSDLAALQGGDATFYAKSIYIKSTTTDASQIQTSEKPTWDTSPTWVPVVMDVAEDVTLEIGNVLLGTSSKGGGFSQIRVGGDFDMSAATSNSSGVYLNFYYRRNTDNNPYTEASPSMIVGGQMKLGSNYLKFDQGDLTERTNPVVQTSGLTGSDAAIFTYASAIQNAKIVFKAKDGEKFTGGVYSGGFVSEYSSGKSFKLVMDDASGGGKQTVNVTRNASSFGMDTVYDASIDVEVRNGLLDLGTGAGGNKFSRVAVTGGTLGVSDEIGSFSAGELVLEGGAVVFDVFGNGASDSITADSLSGTGTQIFMDLSMADFDVNDDLAGFAFEILKGVSGTGLDVEFRYGGALQNFVWHWDNGKVVVDSGTVVPEPAV